MLYIKKLFMTFLKDSKEGFNEGGAGTMRLVVEKREQFKSGHYKKKWEFIAKQEEGE